MRSVTRTFSENDVSRNVRQRQIPTHPCERIVGSPRENSLIFMTQKASVEAVAARMHKPERNDFMLRVRAGIR